MGITHLRTATRSPVQGLVTMPPSASTVRGLIADFQQITGASEATAKSFLKASGYRLEPAVDSFYTSSGSHRKDPLEPKLDSLFESLRGTTASTRSTLHLTREQIKNKMKPVRWSF